MKSTLKEAERLYELGFAILWVYPESKVPIGDGWASGPRKPWKTLEKEYQTGFNVGVRLGSPSQIAKESFLAVIDVDIKSKEPRHRQEANAALSKLIGEEVFPEVESGRGWGSKHLYFVTKAPFKTWNPAVSKEEVKYFSPSKERISKRELQELSPTEIKEGIRLGRAWELSYYSDGRYVVLPPSIHPDTKKPYLWKEKFQDIFSLPLLDISSPGKEGGHLNEKISPIPPHESLEDLEAALKLRTVPTSIQRLIILGSWRGELVTDRSAYLLVAAKALATHGFTKNEILSVLTNRTTVLGECAFDHAKTDSRQRAAQWLWTYTVRRVMEERTAELAFRETAIVDNVLDNKDDIEKQNASLQEGKVDASETGFYTKGKKGALKPAYNELLKQFSDDYPYKSAADMKAVFVFNGAHYEEMLSSEIKGYAEMCFNPKPTEKIRQEFLSKVLVNNQTRRKFFLDTTEGKLNFENGVFDIETCEMLKHSPSYGFRGVLPFEFDPDAKCPQFHQWLSDVMLGDKTLIYLLQEFMGYVVRGGEYKYHKALWLSGKGRNGKSTFIDVLKALVGTRNYSTLSIKSLIGDKFSSSELDGKIANFSEETSPQELVDSGPFKNLTGDGEMNAQKKYGDQYTFRNRAKLIMSYNQIPDLKDLTPGMLSRPIVIPFLRHIKDSEMDREIKQKLISELPGIFNFALRGWQRLEEQEGFTASPQSHHALTQMSEESCTVYQWIENCVEFSDKGDEYLTHQLYAHYKMLDRYPYSFINFARRVMNHPEMRKRKFKSGDKRGFRFIKLL